MDEDDVRPDAGAEAFDDRTVNFAAMIPYRMERLARAARRFADEATAAERAQLSAFRVSQAPWIDDYAVFMALSEAHGRREWSDWPAPLARRDLFLLDEHGRPSVVAGVPPDLFSATGQRCGNPLYRWAAHDT